LADLIFDGLLRYDENGELAPALAGSWTVSEDGRAIQFVLAPGRFWHDGEPVTTADVAFTYGLLQADAFPGSESLKALWRSVTINVIDEQTIEFTLPEPYSPFLEATTRGILPAHILEGISPSALAGDEFNRSPVGTGPFFVERGQNWESSGRLRLLPAPDHWRQGTQISALEYRFFPDEAALLEAFANGDVQAMNRVLPLQIPTVTRLDGTRLSTSVAGQYTALLFNQSETGMPALRDKTVRQALAYALDRKAMLDHVLRGQGVLFEGPYLPQSPAYKEELWTAYTTQPITATQLLDSAGWPLAGGQPLRQRDGAPLSVRILVYDTPTHRAVGENLAAQWTSFGVSPQLVLISGWDEFRQRLAARDFDVALVDIVPPHDPDLYDFWSQEAIVRGQNFAAWNNRRASEALEMARQLWPWAERLPHYDTFQTFFDADLPALTLYQHVTTYALQDSVNLAEIGRFTRPRDRYQTFADWFLLYRDVMVSCPAASNGS
jgi:peptide/nickel transport system substrate-binding protein